MTVPPICESDYYSGYIRDNSEANFHSGISLPFFHTCRGEDFRKIVSSGVLVATRCKEFEEDLLYVFYGRPAYRVGGSLTTLDLGHFPVCFMLDKSSVQGVKRIFPFDTGAFLANILEEYCGHFSTKGDAINAVLGYNLGADLSDLAKFVDIVYGSDEHYLAISPELKPESLKGMCFELCRILDMARSKSAKVWDSRALTAEVQAESSIPITGENVKAIIIPTPFISNDRKLQDYLYAQGIDVIDYSISRTKPGNVTELIEREVEAYRGELMA